MFTALDPLLMEGNKIGLDLRQYYQVPPQSYTSPTGYLIALQNSPSSALGLNNSSLTKYGPSYCFLAHTSENHPEYCAATSPINLSDIRSELMKVCSRIPVVFARMRQKAVHLYPSMCRERSFLPFAT
jgi:hypothetical protein